MSSAPVVASNDTPPTETGRRPPPFVTYAVIVLCAVNFLLFNLVKGPRAQVVSDILAPNNIQIWHGAVWGLVTSAFVHVAFWHLLFNVMWARDFGRLLEPDMRAARYLGFLLVAAVVSSGWQLLVSATTGIGFSGVVYAMFGYVLARRRSHPTYDAFVTPRTIQWMLGWLVLCLILTFTGLWSVANAAHVAGLALGYLIGFSLERPQLRGVPIAGGTLMLTGVVLACTWMPWSPDWQARNWLHYVTTLRRQAEAGDAHSQAHYGSVLMRWPEGRVEGLKWLRRSAESGHPEGMNGLAWWLATAREDKLRDGAEAVRWAEKAYEADPQPIVADTLAAAYAEADRWNEAISTQERVVRLELKPEERKIFSDHLEGYKKHQKWRE